jgi:hypothetical protein
VVLKEIVLRTLADRTDLEAFNGRAEALTQLRHCRLPRVVWAFREGEGVHERFYLAQEYIEGESLQARLAVGALSEKEARAIATQLLDILGYLDEPQVQVSHGDIKPANLIVDSRKALWLVGCDLTSHSRGRPRTLGYGPPEDRDGKFDARFDLYAAGATLAHLVSGQSPAALRDEKLQIAIPGLRLSGPFRRFLRALLAPHREDRPANSQAALAMLRWPGPLSIPSVRRGLAAAVAAMAVAVAASVTHGLLNRAPTLAPAAGEPSAAIFPEVPATVDQESLTIPSEDPGHVAKAIPVHYVLPGLYSLFGIPRTAILTEVLLYRYDLGTKQDLVAVVEYGPPVKALADEPVQALRLQFVSDSGKPLKGSQTACVDIDPSLLPPGVACASIHTVPMVGDEMAAARRYRLQVGEYVVAAEFRIDFDQRIIERVPLPARGSL